jgi:hypothetical protein
MERIRKEGYQYWVNGISVLSYTHPNDWKFEKPDGINYINTYAGMKIPGVLFEGGNILRMLEEADSLEEAYEAVQKTINKVNEINDDLLVEENS